MMPDRLSALLEMTTETFLPIIEAECLGRNSVWRIAVLACVLFLPKQAFGEIVDCVALSKSLTPYQLTMRDEKGAELLWQILRGNERRRVQYTERGGVRLKLELQSNFTTKLFGFQDRATTLHYNISTDRFIWELGSRAVTISPAFDGHQQTSYERYYQNGGNESFQLGRCKLITKRYRILLTKDSSKPFQDVWFSPELNTVVKEQIVDPSSDGMKIISSIEAIEITTKFDFKPTMR